MFPGGGRGRGVLARPRYRQSHRVALYRNVDSDEWSSDEQ